MSEHKQAFRVKAKRARELRSRKLAGKSLQGVMRAIAWKEFKELLVERETLGIWRDYSDLPVCRNFSTETSELFHTVMENILMLSTFR